MKSRLREIRNTRAASQNLRGTCETASQYRVCDVSRALSKMKKKNSTWRATFTRFRPVGTEKYLSFDVSRLWNVSVHSVAVIIIIRFIIILLWHDGRYPRRTKNGHVWMLRIAGEYFLDVANQRRERVDKTTAWLYQHQFGGPDRNGFADCFALAGTTVHAYDWLIKYVEGSPRMSCLYASTCSMM